MRLAVLQVAVRSHIHVSARCSSDARASVDNPITAPATLIQAAMNAAITELEAANAELNAGNGVLTAANEDLHSLADVSASAIPFPGPDGHQDGPAIAAALPCTYITLTHDLKVFRTEVAELKSSVVELENSNADCMARNAELTADTASLRVALAGPLTLILTLNRWSQVARSFQAGVV